MARPRNEARAHALRYSYTMYHGAPCAHGHSGLRYASNSYCVACRAVANTARPPHTVSPAGLPDMRSAAGARALNTFMLIYAPEEFDRAGWRQVARAGGAE